MKTLLRTFLLVCALALVTGAIKTATAFAYSSRPSATGFGQINDDMPGGNRTSLAFTAITKLDDTPSDLTDNPVTGQAEYHFVREDPFFPEDVRLHIEINCLNIDPDGKTATMSGVVKNSNRPEANGATAIFRVRDNGEGKSNEADGITQVFLLAPNLNRNCNTLTGIQPVPITAGNVQVRP